MEAEGGHLLLQGTKVPLLPVDPDGQAVFQREVLGMLREHGSVSTWSSPLEDVLLFILEPQRKTGTGDT